MRNSKLLKLKHEKVGNYNTILIILNILPYEFTTLHQLLVELGSKFSNITGRLFD